MYKNIIVTQFSAENYYRELIANGLGQKEWVSCYLPVERDGGTNPIEFPTLSSNQMIFTFLTLLSVRIYSIKNLSLVGFIFPILFEMPDHTKQYHDDSELQERIAMKAMWYMHDIHCTFLALVISGKESPQLGKYDDPDWWQPEALSLLNSRRIDMSRIKVAVCSIYHLDRLPHIIADKLEIRPDSVLNSGPSSRLPHPHIPNATFELKHLGCADGASLGFVEDCLEGILSGSCSVRVWVDVREKAECTYRYDMQKVDLGSRYVSWNTQNGIHVYLEYEGCTFDSMMAFQEPISIYEFQKNLSSSWRTYIDITPDMSLEEAKSAVREMVGNALSGING